MLSMRNMMKPSHLFTLAILTPVGLLALGSVSGGIWIALALIYLTILVSGFDQLIQQVIPAQEFPNGVGLSVTLALAHFALLPLVVFALAGDTQTMPEKLGLFFAAGLFFGQVSNANAHELIHLGGGAGRQLGRLVYASVLFGHHSTSHPAIHHRPPAQPAPFPWPPGRSRHNLPHPGRMCPQRHGLFREER